MTASQPKNNMGQRQVPKAQSITSNKLYSDLIYGYLQTVSDFEGAGEARRISRSKVVFTQIGSDLGISNKTCKKYFDALIALGLIYQKEEKGDYYLRPLEKQEGYLMPFETLDTLVRTVMPRVINIYVYLMTKWYENKNQSFNFTIKELKAYCGDSVKARNNDEDNFKAALILLFNLSLIDYEPPMSGQQGKPYCFKHGSVNLRTP